MKLLVTGAAGHLGRHLIAELAARHEVLGIDLVNPEPMEGVRFAVADLADRAALDALFAAEGPFDIVVHCASIHPWKPYSDDQYMDANVKGTWHLYSALGEAGVRKVVLTSSIAVNGYSVPPEDWPVSEDKSYPTPDIYSFTKRVQEDTAEFFARKFGIQTIALRPSAFMPRPALETGLALLTPFSVVSDIAGAHVAAVEYLATSDVTPGLVPVFVTNRLPYDAADAERAKADGNWGAAVRRHFPEAAAWHEANGSQGNVFAVFDLSKAKSLLGWEPKFNFGQWWSEHGD